MRTFNARLAGIVVVAVGVRLVAAWFNRHYPVQGDALVYHGEAAFVAQGDGFRRLFQDVPTAEHPPLHVILLAGFDLLGANSEAAQKALLGLVGSCTVLVIGLLGRSVGGERVGLIAAGIAAVYPMLWLPDAALMSETTSTLLVALVLLVAYRQPRTVRVAALLGALIGLAALSRGELLGLLLLLVLDRRHWWVAALACVVVLAPWTIRNALTFNTPVLISSNTGGLIAGANCHRSYYTPEIGAWVYTCLNDRPPGDEAEADSGYRARGLRYARDHLGRLPLVVVVRLGRLLDVYRPLTQGVFFNGAEGRNPRATRVALVFYWLLLPFGIAGAIWAGRRGYNLLVPVGLVLLVGVLAYGSTRFRTAAEPSLVVFSALALPRVVRAARARAG